MDQSFEGSSTPRLSNDVDKVLGDFINSYDTNSQALKIMMTQVFRTFVKDVGLKDEYTQQDIDDWITKREERNKKPNNNCRLFLQKFMAFRGQDNLTLRKVKKHKIVKKRVPTREQAINIILQAKSKFGYKYALFFKFVEICGIRKNEGLNTRPIDLHFINGAPRVMIRGKGNRERYVLIPLDFYEKVMDYIIKNGIKDSEPIFNIEYRDAQSTFERSCIAAGYYNYKPYKKYRLNKDEPDIYQKKVSMFSLHRFRHRRATEWSKEYSLKEVSRMLGHSDISTTERYIDLDYEQMLDKWAKVEREKFKSRVMISKGYNEDQANRYMEILGNSLPERGKKDE